MTILDAELQMLAELDGLIPPELGHALYTFAYGVPPFHAIIEVGSYKGQSTCYLGAGARAGAGARVTAIDPWDLPGNVDGKHHFHSARPFFDAQLRKMGLVDRVLAIQGFAVEVAHHWGGARVGLLYIDGDHSEKSVMDDFLAWERHLARHALVLFDDYDTPRNPGVRKAVESLREFLTPPVIIAGRLAWCRYRGPL